MKKRLLLVLLCVSMLTLAVGCSNDEKNEEDKKKTEDTKDETSKKEIPEYKVEDYVVLGNYTGLEGTMEIKEITDTQVDEEITFLLESNRTFEKTEKTTVEEGDEIDMDYEGLLDGVAFDGGTATGAIIKVGESGYIDGFDAGLVGATVGNQVSLNLTFPEDYHSKDLAGKAVVFNVTVNSIGQYVTPELTEEIIQSVSDVKTEDEYRVYLKEQLQTEANNSARSTAEDQIKTQVIANATVDKMPEGLLEARVSEYKDTEKAAAKSYGYEFEEYLTSIYGMTEEEYDTNMSEYMKESVKVELVLEAIAKAEGIELTDEEYEQYLTDYSADYGYESKEALEKEAGKDTCERIFMNTKTWDFILASATIKEVAAPPEVAPETETTPETTPETETAPESETTPDETTVEE